MNDFRVPAAESATGAPVNENVTEKATFLPKLAGSLRSTGKGVRRMFFTNPMRMEIVRFKSRFVNCTSFPAFNRAMVWATGFSYLIILGLVFAARKDVNPVGMVMAQSIILCLATVLAAHGSIAAERDRRSWDLLQVAPISQGQIVIGKFGSILALVAASAVLFFPFSLIGLLFYSPLNSVQPLFAQTAVAEVVAISSALAVGAYTMYLSAKLKSANAALAGAVATIVGVLGASVGVLAALNQPRSTEEWEQLLFWHPMYVIERFFEGGQIPLFWGWAQSAAYLGLAWFLLVWTTALLKRRAKE